MSPLFLKKNKIEFSGFNKKIYIKGLQIKTDTILIYIYTFIRISYCDYLWSKNNFGSHTKSHEYCKFTIFDIKKNNSRHTLTSILI